MKNTVAPPERKIFAALVMLLLSACAPTAKPGGHLQWKLHLEETPTNCGADAVFAARELEVEVWIAHDGVQVMRFVSPTALGSVVLPEGVWTTNGVFVSDLPGQRIELSVAQPADGGAVEGFLTLTTTCTVKVPFSIERVTLPVTELAPKQFLVAVQSKGPICAPEQAAPQHVQFEVWTLSDDALTLPVSSARYADGVTGVLRADGSRWSEGEALTVSNFIDALQNRGSLHFVNGSCDVTREFFAVSR